MRKNHTTLDWNAAYQQDEDWNAAMDSEVFRTFASKYLQIEAEEESEKKEQEEKSKKEKLEKDHDSIMEKLKNSTKIDYDILRNVLAQQLGLEVPEVEDVVEMEVQEEPVQAPIQHQTEEDLYHTNAGESDYIDIGLTDETIKSMTEHSCCCDKSSVEEATKEVMDVYQQEELSEAENFLGLNTNIAYLTSNLKA